MKNFWREHRHFILSILTTLLLMVGVFFIQGETSEYMADFLNVEQPAPFDGTSLPIKTLPDWSRLNSAEFSLLAAAIPSAKITTLPNYDPAIFGTVVAATNWNSVSNTLRNQLITYPVPYMGSYESGSKEYEGSHLAIDIKAPTGTSVYAVANGKVVKVSEASSGFGKHIVIEHPNVPALDSNATITLYSAYAHLSKIFVAQGQVVRRGDLIGETGATGTATTPHLHFQIDQASAPWHPWWPFTSADTAAAGVSFFDGVSAGINQAAAIANTINPMLWVQRYLVSGNNTFTPNPTETSTATDNSSLQTNTTTDTSNTTTLADNNTTTTDTSTNLHNSAEQAANTSSDATTTTTPTPTVKKIFTDLDSTNPNFQAIQYLKEQNIISGYSDGSFQPEKTVTRVEALKMLALGLDVDCTYAPTPNFPDAAIDAWYAEFVGCALFHKIANGYPDGTFRPANDVNRAEYLKILLSSAKVKPGRVSRNPYSDVAASDWFATFARYSKEANILPITGSYFQGDKSMTRAEVAETIYRMIVLQKNQAVAYSPDLAI